MRSVLAAIISIAMGLAPAHARDTTNEVLPGCQDYVAVGTGKGRAERADIVSTTECVSTVHTILLLEQLLIPTLRFCRPDKVTVNDAVELVVRELGTPPKFGDKPFFIAVIATFRELWPCNEPATAPRSSPLSPLRRPAP
jgi:hypothetical protein